MNKSMKIMGEFIQLQQKLFDEISAQREKIEMQQRTIERLERTNMMYSTATEINQEVKL